MLDKIKNKIEKLLNKDEETVRAEQFFNTLSLPIIGIKNSQIFYKNEQFVKLFSNFLATWISLIKEQKKTFVKVNDDYYLMEKIVGHEVEYYLIKKETAHKIVPLPYVIINVKGEIIWHNDLFVKTLYSNELTKKNSLNLFDIIDKQNIVEFKNALCSTEIKGFQSVEVCVTDNRLIYLVKIAHDDKDLFHCYFLDIMRYKQLEMNLIHSQKMQAIGQLAGGVAHDFNNLLTAILGFCDLLLFKHSVGDPSFSEIMQIKQNSIRATSLVKQLLTISRKQMLVSRPIDLAATMSDLKSLIRRLVRENIEVKIYCEKDLQKIKMDQGQFEQILINLAVNARDAIVETKKEGGLISISLKNSSITVPGQLEKKFVSPPGIALMPPGEYVLVEVADNGGGIPEKITNKIFAPFFSTKAPGEGTGLGLSTTHGIIHQVNGYLYIDSKEGKGTKFYIYFRATKDEKPEKTELCEEVENKLLKKDFTGTATILFVEDERSVRIFGIHALSRKGYRVLEAADGEEGLKKVQEHGKEIDLIITDAIMPGLNGPSLVMEIQKTYPDMKVLFISGYTEENLSSYLQTTKQLNFLPKPFTLNTLITKVQEILEKN